MKFVSTHNVCNMVKCYRFYRSVINSEDNIFVQKMFQFFSDLFKLIQ